ncbi:MAG TPA: hypothetical protein G4O02_15160 [Caldilineae bacterium]|nr:hypothetical protein [Caldilineae bacterium]
MFTTCLFTIIQPDFLTQVVSHHLKQGADISLLDAVVKGIRLLIDFIDFVAYQPLFILLAALGIIAAVRRLTPPRQALLAQLPTALAFLLIKRGVEIRYLVYLVPTLSLFWAAALVETTRWLLRRPRSVLARALAVPLVMGLGAWSLMPHLVRDAFIAQRGTQRYVPAVTFLRQHTSPDDVIVSEEQWLNFLAQRPTTRTAAAISEGAASSGQITAQLLRQEIEETRARAVVLDFGASGRQLHAMSDFADFYRFVQENFALVRIFGQGEDILEVYLRDDVMPIRPDLRFGGGLALTGADLGPSKLSADEARTAFLRWQMLAPMGVDLSYSLRLFDEAGHLWAQVDGPIRALRFREGVDGKPFDVSTPTSGWEVGQVAMNKAEMRLPPGIPPGRYHIHVRVYRTADGVPLPAADGEGRPIPADAPLGEVEITPARMAASPEQLSLARPLTATWPGLRLLGTGQTRREAMPGDAFTLDLYWQATDTSRPAYRVQIALKDERDRLVSQSDEILGSEVYPTDRWRPGEAIHTKHMVAIPATASGRLDLVLRVYDEASRAVGKALQLGSIEVHERARVFDLPPDLSHPLDVRFGDVARLVGYRLGHKDGNVRLTLVWQALRTAPRGYMVFVHLIDGIGAIVAQQDRVPMDGMAPTTSWLPGEVIVDEYVLLLSTKLLPGEYRIRIGLYDPETLIRLPVEGADAEGAQNGFILPAPVVISRS